MQLHQAAQRVLSSASRAATAAGDAAAGAAHRRAAKAAAAAAAAARRAASAAAFRLHNASLLNTFVVDLHGCHVDEALLILERHVTHLSALRNPAVLLRVVTGAGRHSREGRPVLLPAVVRWLSSRGLLCDTEEDNPGMIRVLLE
jgi:DNA-nicking Smr family endonuclease